MKTVAKLALLCMVLTPWLPAHGDDSDIFYVNVVEPNVVILLDSSGSMNDSINGMRKIDSAKLIVNSLINTVQGVRIGVFRFNAESTSGLLVSPVGEDPATMVAQVNSIIAGGATPLGRATRTVQNYYNGAFTGSTCTGACDGDGDVDPGEVITDPVGYPSPIQYACQKNYVIVVTDGMPNGEPADMVANVATSLFTSDHSPLAGVQNVIVHTVGFDVPAGTTHSSRRPCETRSPRSSTTPTATRRR